MAAPEPRGRYEEPVRCVSEGQDPKQTGSVEPVTLTPVCESHMLSDTTLSL